MSSATVRASVVIAAVFAGMASWLPAIQGQQIIGQNPTPDEIAALAKKPTPRLPDKRVDLNGTWDHVDGIAFLKPQDLGSGSLCLVGCAQPARGGGAGGGGAAATPAGRSGGAAAAPAPAPAGKDFPKYKPEFLAKVQDLMKRQVEMDTVLQCHPPGVPRIGPPHKIVQNAREVVFLYDDVSGAFFRIVPTDGRPHRKDLPESFLGDAIGRWDGDTLVVETVNFNEETWLTDNGAFHTANLKVIERFRRVGDTIEYQAIVHDPDVLAEPWALRPQVLWISEHEMEEPVLCRDQDLQHVVDGTHHDNPR
jgi:hypothetical protein